MSLLSLNVEFHFVVKIRDEPRMTLEWPQDEQWYPQNDPSWTQEDDLMTQYDFSG